MCTLLSHSARPSKLAAIERPILTNPIFQALIEAQGIGFLAVGSAAEANAAIANPELWHLRKGFKVIAQVIVPAIAEIHRLIEEHHKFPFRGGV